MSRDYARITPAFWTGETGRRIRALGAEARVVATYLVTSPHASGTGLYWLPLAYIAHDTGSPIEGASKALQSLSEADFAHYDETTETVWVPGMASIQVGESMVAKDKRHPWLLKEIEKCRKSPYFHDFIRKYGTAYNIDEQAPPKTLPRVIEAPSMPLRSQEQEREQEQETDGDLSRARERATPGAPVTHRDVEETFSRLRSQAPDGGKYKRVGSRDWTPIDTLTQWANGEADPRQALERSLRGFLADPKTRPQGYPLQWWANDPGRYQAAPLEHAPAKGHAPPKSHEEFRKLIAENGGSGEIKDAFL